MFPSVAVASTVPAAPADRRGGVDLQWLLDAVTGIDCNASDAQLIDRIAALERLKCGAAAAQARLTATFADSQTADGVARHQQPDTVRRSIAGQVALARRDSPHAGRRHVGVAAALVSDLPHTLAALTRGELSERRARIVVEQLGCLTPADRREADQLLAPELAAMSEQPTRRLAPPVGSGGPPISAAGARLESSGQACGWPGPRSVTADMGSPHVARPPGRLPTALDIQCAIINCLASRRSDQRPRPCGGLTSSHRPG